MLGVAVDMLADVEIGVEIGALIGLELTFKGACAVEVLAAVSAGATTGGASNPGDEVNTSGLATVMNTLEFALPSPLEEPLLCCCASFSRWLMTVLDCIRTLHACKPSYHV